MLDVFLFVGSGLVWTAAIRLWRAGREAVRFEARLPVPWNGFDVAILALSAIFFEGVAASLIVQPGSEPAALSAASVIALSLGRIVWLALAAAYLIFFRGAYRDDLGWDTSWLPADERLGVLGYLAAAVPVFVVQALLVYVLKVPSTHPIIESMKQGPNVGLMVLTTLMAVIVAPVAEEFGFRVLLQGWLERRQTEMRRSATGDPNPRPGFAPSVIASVVFALMHLAHGADPVALFVFSLFLGYLYRQTHRIFPSLTVHMCLNGLTMLQLWIMAYAGPK